MIYRSKYRHNNPIKRLTYLTMNSITGLNLTMTDGCIRQGALRTLNWTGLYLQCEEATSSPPTKLWLVCRERVENLEERIKILKGFSCRIIRRF